MTQATFGAGCFWGVEAAFRQVKGVTATAAGFMGGTLANPTYEDVCTDRTGHAEVVQVEYAPEQVSYDHLLDVFWGCHDPSDRPSRWPETASQYRSAIFYHTPEQQAAALASKARLQASGRYTTPIVTEITPASQFYRADEYHQQYYEKWNKATCKP